MKNLVCIALLGLSFSVVAQTIELPSISAPSELTQGEFAEGTMTRLTSAEVAEFLPWAQNARNQLNRAMTQARSLPLRERLPHIERAVRSVVVRSGNRQYQSNMRFSLNRGLLLVDELERNVNMNEIGSQESALDILQRSITVGLSFYESDLAFQERAQAGGATTVIAHAAYGAAFMQEMYPAVVNVLDATAQYRLLYKLIEMVNWDLSRDSNAPAYAEVIVEAYEMGQDLPEQPSGDDKANLRLIRRLNSLRIVALKGNGANVQNNNDADLPTIAEAPARVPTPDPEVDNEVRGYAFDSASSVVRRVSARAANGSVIFADGVTRSSNYVQELVRSKGGISMGDKAFDSASSVIRTVRYITVSGTCIFTDGVTRTPNYVQALVSSRNGISTGGNAFDSASNVIRRVSYITISGTVVFSDGVNRTPNYVQGLVSSRGGISVGDNALDTASNVLRRVSFITTSGVYVFSDGVSRTSNYVSRVN